MKSKTELIINELIEAWPTLAECKEDIASAFECIKKSYVNNGKLLVCGNGGSAADSSHIVGELMKGFKLPRKLSDSELSLFEAVGASEVAKGLQGALPAISLVGEMSLMTAFLNDCSPDLIYAQQVYGLMKCEDVLVCLSTSGNSVNVYNAALTARAKRGKVISITGQAGGRLSSVSDVIIRLPSAETFRIQEYTLPVYHALCAMLEEEFFGE